jgi:hypothetical protein
LILAAESQNQSGALSSLPLVSEFIESYWIPRGLARKRIAVFRSLSGSRMIPP